MHHTRSHISLAALLMLSTAGGTLAVDRSIPGPGVTRDQLAEDTRGQARVVSDPATGVAGLVSVPSGALELDGDGEKARAFDFFARYGDAFGLDNPGRDLVLEQTREDRVGMTHLRFNQTYLGVPVFGCVMRLHFDDRENLVSVNGSLVPHLDLDPTPTIDEVEASAIARQGVAKDHGQTAYEIESTGAELMIYRTGLDRR